MNDVIALMKEHRSIRRYTDDPVPPEDVRHAVGRVGQIGAVRIRGVHGDAADPGAVETAREGFVLLDRDYKITDVNEMYCKMTGYRREEIIGKTPLDFCKILK